ncbi:hypothetical protein ACGFZ3_06490 [Stenotrophomonas sp. NPDC047960]|uniref:hypothetical protein n=1 Tax=Stenotrophomonas sp. NPDC047960 TaxID=3364531 RepID=UPI00371E8D5F
MKKKMTAVAVCCLSLMAGLAHAGECKPGGSMMSVDKREASPTHRGYVWTLGLEARATTNLEQLRRDLQLERSSLTVGREPAGAGMMYAVSVVGDSTTSTCVVYEPWRQDLDSAGLIGEVMQMDGTPPGICIDPDGRIAARLQVHTIIGTAPFVRLVIPGRDPSRRGLDVVFKENGCPD